ncbi:MULTISPECIES: DNA polymerase IV [unclassified Mannheimia]|uniref:DNA polymerase IV n=1 Tax=unclassified Mannheimia TaxID=2645054 RepID=UPI00359D723E
MATQFQRKIIHIDMDCFYAAVEMRKNPSLVGKPIAVGGSPNQRGVLATCNYEARKFGLHSAMATATALKKCPNLVLLPVNMPLYKAVSAQIHEIFHRYTDVIEALSLDEAYLDVSECERYLGSATWIAQAIRNDIFNELKLTASAGVAPLKFLAKIASDQNKPNGQFVIKPDDVQNFVKNLPLAKIPGVGKVTNEKLKQLGFETCGDIQQTEKAMIYREFGKFGQRLWDFSHGIDERAVEPYRPRKSLAVEKTLLDDIWTLEQAKFVIAELFDKLTFRIQRNVPDTPLSEFKKLGLKLKFDDFTQTTLERTTEGFSYQRFEELLEQIFVRRNERKIRLIGLNVHFSEKKVNKQLNLWE